MRKLWLDEAWEEYLVWQTQDRKTLKKINRIVFRIKDENLEIIQCGTHYREK